MSLAIAYQMKKRGRKMAHGGMEGPCEEHGAAMCKMCHGGEYAKGGEADKLPHLEGELNGRKGHWKIGKPRSPGDAPYENKTGDHSPFEGRNYDDDKPIKKAEGGEIDEEEASGYEPDPMEHESHPYAHKEENQEFPEDEHDMVSRIMKQRMKSYSKGGRVANDDHMEADFEPNQFDDLVKDDHLEFHDTGANSGDELGDEAEDEDRHDIVSRIMKSRKLKDRNPRIT